MHRNTFINSPRLLNASYSLRSDKEYFCRSDNRSRGLYGIGLLRNYGGAERRKVPLGKEPLVLPNTTVTGALARYISDETVTNFQPMGANFGMLPPLPEKIRDKSERYTAIAERGMRDLEEYLKSLGL